MSFAIIFSVKKRFLWGSFAWGSLFFLLICLEREKGFGAPVLTSLGAKAGDSKVLFPTHKWGIDWH